MYFSILQNGLETWKISTERDRGEQTSIMGIYLLVYHAQAYVYTSAWMHVTCSFLHRTFQGLSKDEPNKFHAFLHSLIKYVQSAFGDLADEPKNQRIMAIQATIVARKRPAGSEVKHYVTPKIVKMASQKDVAKLMSRGMTITEREAELAIQQMVYAVSMLLRQGHSVRITDLGTFSLSFKSTGSDTKEEVTVENVKQINCNLRLNSAFKAELQDTEIVLIKDKKN